MRVCVCLLGLLTITAHVRAQTPAAAPAPSPAEPDTYRYQADGRRDPFVNLLGTGVEPRLPTKRMEGVTGLSVGEISVRGVVQSRGSLIAMIQGADKRTYIVHAGDKLADGAIKAITTQGLIIVQEVTDPMSLVKQREIRRSLRSVQDGKE